MRLVVLAAVAAFGMGCATGDVGDGGAEAPAVADAGVSVDARAPAPPSDDDAAAFPSGDAATTDASMPTGDAAGPPHDAAPAPRCGDGFIDAALAEVCDDGNTIAGDGCSADCKSVECTMAESWEDPATHRCFWRDERVRDRATCVSHCDELAHGFPIRWDSPAERDAVYAKMFASSGGIVWIGLQRVNGAWTWDDGAPASAASLNWGHGAPFAGDACAQWNAGNWIESIDCGAKRDVVCERKPAGTPR